MAAQNILIPKKKRIRYAIPTYRKVYVIFQYDRQKFADIYKRLQQLALKYDNPSIFYNVNPYKVLNLCYLRDEEGHLKSMGDEQHIFRYKVLQNLLVEIANILKTDYNISFTQDVIKYLFEHTGIMISVFDENLTDILSPQAEILETSLKSIKERIIVHITLLRTLRAGYELEDAAQAKAELNSALRELFLEVEFAFRQSEQDLTARSNGAAYSIPNGQIVKIYNKDDLSELTFIGDSSNYDKEAKGEPTGYWVQPNNPEGNIRLYPIPDKKYNYSIVYNEYRPVMNTDGDLFDEFQSSTDYLNLPSRLEYYFMDCLVRKTIIQHNSDNQDENYEPYIKEFNERWKRFKKLCQPAKLKYKVVW